MSGIGGIFRRDLAAVDGFALNAILERLKRRGPDAAGTWLQGPLGLAQTQLWSTPESLAETLPLTSGDLTLVMDGRIDNRAELLPQLDLGGRPAAEIADSQVVLAAYRKWGAECLPRLLGDFAFAVWHASNKQLFCARDVFGVRPFYYYLDNERFVFGSEIKVLLALGDIPRDLNEDAIAGYLLELFEHNDHTFYTRILRLPPASYLLVTPGSFQLQSYWALDGERELRLKNSQEYAQAYRELFVQSARARLRSAYPVASALSGGLDSSAITCVSGRLLAEQGRTLHTYSAIFEDVPASDERPFMQAVLDQGIYNPHFVRGDQASPIALVDTYLAEQDQPFYAPNMFLDYEIWKTVAQHGNRVYLEGLFGDNVTDHGYFRLNELARGWRWWALYRQIGLLSRNHADPQPLPTLMLNYFVQDGLKANLPASLLGFYRRLRGHPARSQQPLPVFIDAGLAGRTGVQQRLDAAAHTAQQASTTRVLHLHELQSGIIPAALEIYSTGSATFSLDVRFNFLDRRLAEFCLAIPADQKLDNGYSRMIARRGMEVYLPEQIRWRTGKGDLSHNLVYLLQKEQGKLNDLLSTCRDSLQGYLNLPVLDRWKQRVAAGQATHQQVLTVYLAVILARWLSSRDGVQNGAEGGGRMPRTATIQALPY